mgnify:CR=1 FL=1
MLRSSFFVVVIVISIAITLASVEEEWKPVYIQPEQLHISLGGK